MNQRSPHILDRIIREKPSRESRLTELLKDPSADSPEGWFMCVPTCFNDALDIKQTQRIESKRKSLVWTQGSTFSFKEGDQLYNTPSQGLVGSRSRPEIRPHSSSSLQD